MDDFTQGGDSIQEMYLFESNQLLEQLEEVMLETEQNGTLSEDGINQIFRIMHTVKGSSAMMDYTGISKLAHSLEDLFYYIRENKPQGLDISRICDIVLSVSDFIKEETAKIQAGSEPDGDASELKDGIHAYLGQIRSAEETAGEATGGARPAEKAAPEKPEKAGAPERENLSRYIVKLYFDDGSQMENIRAFSIYNNLCKIAGEIYTVPKDVLNSSSEEIMMHGFIAFFATGLPESQIRSIFEESLYVKSYEFEPVESYEKELLEYGLKEEPAGLEEPSPQPEAAAETEPEPKAKNEAAAEAASQTINETLQKSGKLSLISVNVNKLDVLMDIVGEIVITESMVTKSPDLKGLRLENFEKAARQLRKITDELQDIVMSIRMVPIAGTFQKMHRIVRDMSHKLQKDVNFVTRGEETEVDKNIVDRLSDPLMHLIRNAMDHGIETEEERIRAGKPPKGRVSLSAANTGGEIVISVTDDGRGLDRKKIYEKAHRAGLIEKTEQEVSDREIYQCIMQPGFSTKEEVSEFSGRGVGMDVVKKNIEEVGGRVSVSSETGKGSTISILIPLTLAIADAMELSVGQSVYTMPMLSIRESFRPKQKDIIYDDNGNEMILIRGNCYPIVRLHMLFNQHTEVTKLEDGVLILVEGDSKSICLFVDRLIGEQQVVVKPLPAYLFQYSLKDFGVEGCTILGDGSISLILDAKSIIDRFV